MNNPDARWWHCTHCDVRWHDTTPNCWCCGQNTTTPSYPPVFPGFHGMHILG